MLADVSLFGALAPSLLIYFVAALGLFIPLVLLAGRCGVDRLAWNPPLARFGLFLCLFSILALLR
jgi:hypothetical protein